MSRDRGALAIVLHSHMPYVEGFGTWPFGEEWLWEAIAAVYLPLLDLLEGSAAPVTVGLTPVLCDQLETLPGDAGERLLAFLSGTRRAVHAEDSRGLDDTGHPELAAEVSRAGLDYARAEETLRAGGRHPLRRLAALGRRADVELMTSSATHAVLPLLASDAGLRLQLASGVASHERRFHPWAGGLWLPECAYAPGLERELADHGARRFCVDQTEVHGLGAPEHLEPVATAAEVVAVPIDWQTVQLVWSDTHGYPVHPVYRDYHRRTVHDLRPWSNGGGPYRPAQAAELAREHAREFVARCIDRLDRHHADRGSAGLLTFALDTELLGHWWYEGQGWLRAVFDQAESQGLDLVTLEEGVDRVPAVQRELAPSSWGDGKDLSTWDRPGVAGIAFDARRAELHTVAAAARTRPVDGARRAALERAARELMALQSSDWAFQVTNDLAADYPQQRMAGHRAAHDAALSGLGDSAAVLDPALRNLAPDLDLAPLLTP
jgi:1,4-alpha-glucan branching enzyme